MKRLPPSFFIRPTGSQPLPGPNSETASAVTPGAKRSKGRRARASQPTDGESASEVLTLRRAPRTETKARVDERGGKRARHAFALADVVRSILANGTTPTLLEKLYTDDPRWWVRRRLRAVRHVLLGCSIAFAATVADTTVDNVKRWLAIAARAGWSGLKSYKIEEEQQANDQRLLLEIEQRLKEELAPIERRRLKVIRGMLSGNALTDRTARDGYAISTVSRWISAVRNYGVNSLYVAPRDTEKLIDGDPAVFRALASTEPDASTRKALNAMALLAEGASVDHAATISGIAAQTLRKRLTLYRDGGLRSLRSWRRITRHRNSY